MIRWWSVAMPLGLLCCLLVFRPNGWLGCRESSFPPPKLGPVPSSAPNPWHNLVPSASLDYHPCYDGLQCARLEVPMNWKAGEGEGGGIVEIAVLRRPAKVVVTNPRYGGAILVNPGGPAASGILHALTKGEKLQNIVDSPANEDGLFFDIIGFDPRGVGYTTPRLECFPDYLSRQYWALQGAAGEAITSTNASFARKMSHAAALSQSCVDRAVHHNASIAYHMNSAPFVEDMVAIIERHGEWREKTAAALLGLSESELRRRELSTQDEPPSELATSWQRTKWKVGNEKLLYWGVSYGTVPGQLFAHLHPDRVSRLLLDGVVDTDLYLGSKWDAPIAQSDDILDFFFSSCSRSSSCAFRRGDKEGTRARFNALLDSLAKKPLPVSSSTKPTIAADIITSSDVQRLIRDAVYYPLKLFPYVDGILVELEHGNGTTLAVQKQSALRSGDTQLGRCGPDTAFGLECHDPSTTEIEAVISIMCSDNRVIDSMSDESFAGYVDSLQNRSVVIGWYWAEMQMPCRWWSVKPKWHIDAPLHANTAEPILLIGNTLDPVTPLHSALKAAKQFPGSAVLHQDSLGHSSLSSPSLCTAKTVRAYFQAGKIPPPYSECGVDEVPFPEDSKTREGLDLLSSDDRKLLGDLHDLSFTI